MSSFTDQISMLALSQLVIVIWIYRKTAGSLRGNLSIALIISLMAIVLRQHSYAYGFETLHHLLFLPALASPLIIYLLTHAIFVDQEQIKKYVWILGAYYIVARFLASTSVFGAVEIGFVFAFSVFIVPQFVMLYFVIDSVYTLVKGFNVDLIDKRRRNRLIFGIAISLFLLILVSRGFMSFPDPYLENLIPIRLDPLPGYVIAITIFFLSLGFNLVSLEPITITQTDHEGHQENWNLQNHSVDSIRATKKNQKIILEINNLMDNNRFYAQHNLGISDLSLALNCPKHKLRAIINKEMGFKNFNQFLNHYRMEEAAKRLKDSELPISSIALDIGYSSLSTFNSVFKCYFLMTPTQFRNYD